MNPPSQAPSTARQFTQSPLSWFRCPYCNAATYRAVSQTAVSAKPLRVSSQFYCERCRGIARLRNPALMLVALPVVLGAVAFAIAYSPPFYSITWKSRAGVELMAALLLGEILASLAIARLARRFDRM